MQRPSLRYFVAALLFSLGAPSAADDVLNVLYVYNETKFGALFEEFGKQNHLSVNAQFIQQNDLKSRTMERLEKGAAPDAMLMPADHVGLYHFIKYSEVTPQLSEADIPVRIWAGGEADGKIYGAPIFQGNHLVLYYNKSLVNSPAATWEAMFQQKKELQLQGRGAIAWSYDEPYWFLPFLGAFGGWPLENGQIKLDTPAMVQALDFYKMLRMKRLPYPDCSYDCTIEQFKSESVAYTINGEWVGKQFEAALGDKLGVAAIPLVRGNKPMPTFSTHVLAFPNGSLDGAKRKMLIKLINFFQSEAVQKRIWKEMGVFPVEQHAFEFARGDAKGYLQQTLALMPNTRALPSNQAMAFIWDAIGKGFIRHREGALDATEAASYMQHLAERHIRNAERQAQQPETSPGAE